MSEKAERASMVERVARALCRLWLESDGESYEPEYLARCIDESWHQYVTEARAAIEAMRDPTEAMQLAGHNRDRIDNDSRNELDDVVINDVECVHIERMGTGLVWMAVYTKDCPDGYCFWFQSSRKIIKWHMQDDSLRTAARLGAEGSALEPYRKVSAAPVVSDDAPNQEPK